MEIRITDFQKLQIDLVAGFNLYCDKFKASLADCQDEIHTLNTRASKVDALEKEVASLVKTLLETKQDLHVASRRDTNLEERRNEHLYQQPVGNERFLELDRQKVQISKLESDYINIQKDLIACRGELKLSEDRASKGVELVHEVENLRCQLKERDIEVEILKQRANEAAALQDEVFRMRSKLEQASKCITDKSVPTSVPSGQSLYDSKTGSSTPPDVSTLRLPVGIQELVRSHRELQSYLEKKHHEYAKLANANIKIKEKAREFREGLRKSIGTSQSRSNPLNSKVRTSSAEMQAFRDIAPNIDADERQNDAANKPIEVNKEAGSVCTNMLTSSSHNLQSPDSNATTQADSRKSCHSVPKHHDEESLDDHMSCSSPDVPHLVSKRVPKRKRARDKELSPVRIKSEPNSVGGLEPVQQTQIYQDSMDLDEVSLPIWSTSTVGQYSRYPKSQASLDVQVPHDLEWSQNATAPRQYLHCQTKNHQQNSNLGYTNNPATPRLVILSDGQKEHDPDNDNHQSANTPITVIENVAIARTSTSSALQSKTPNPRVSPRISDASKFVKRQRRGAPAVTAEFDEDGENHGSVARLSTSEHGHLDTLTFSQRRVGSLRPSEAITVPGRKAAFGKESFAMNNKFQTPQQPHEPTSRPTRSTTESVTSTGRGMGSKTVSTRWLAEYQNMGRSTPESLRNRNLSELEPSDFRVNPKSNQSYGFAFREVIRGKNARKCLPGCTRSDCCGNKIEKVLRIAGPLPSKKSSLRDALRGAGEEVDDEERLIADYLGDDAGRMPYMSNAEKELILAKARAKQFAGLFGRHRGLYQRQASPPGFWRTDMPTTQESTEDREKARRRVRGQVEERYREAMRPNGQWIFRDELL